MPPAYPPAPRAFMSNILDRIVAYKRQEVAAARERVHEVELEQCALRAPPARDFRAALERGPGVQVIAEVKKASTSAGLIRPDFDPVAHARTYAENGDTRFCLLIGVPAILGHHIH